MSGSIQGADKWICLSPIPKVFLSLICTTEAWEKKTKTNNKESLKRVRKGPAENREKTQGTQYSEAGSLLADRQRVLVAGTSLPSCSSNRPPPPSWAGQVLGSPRTSFPTALLLLLPTQEGQRGHLQLAERWQQEMCQSLRLSPSWRGR